jgi:hypothetical protein
VAQALILANWAGIDTKSAFQARQSARPIIASMGIEDQRRLVTQRGE